MNQFKSTSSCPPIYCGELLLQNTFLAGFHAAFIVCAAFAAIGIFTSLVRGNENKNRQTQPQGSENVAR